MKYKSSIYIYIYIYKANKLIIEFAGEHFLLTVIKFSGKRESNESNYRINTLKCGEHLFVISNSRDLELDQKFWNFFYQIWNLELVIVRKNSK